MSLNDNVMTLKSVTFYILNYWMGFIFWQLKTIKKKNPFVQHENKQNTCIICCISSHSLVISFSLWISICHACWKPRFIFRYVMPISFSQWMPICHAIEKCRRLVLFALEIDLIFVFFEWFLLERSKRRGKKEGEIWKQGWQLVAVLALINCLISYFLNDSFFIFNLLK